MMRRQQARDRTRSELVAKSDCMRAPYSAGEGGRRVMHADPRHRTKPNNVHGPGAMLNLSGRIACDLRRQAGHLVGSSLRAQRPRGEGWQRRRS